MLWNGQSNGIIMLFWLWGEFLALKGVITLTGFWVLYVSVGCRVHVIKIMFASDSRPSLYLQKKTFYNKEMISLKRVLTLIVSIELLKIDYPEASLLLLLPFSYTIVFTLLFTLLCFQFYIFFEKAIIHFLLQRR